jgi:hypothetical protein
VDCHRACPPPEEELLVDSCFDKGDGEAGARYDEPVRLDAGDVGERWWPGGETEVRSGVLCRMGIPRSRSTACGGGRNVTVERE